MGWLTQPESSRVVEAASEAFVIIDAVRAAAHEVRVVPAHLVRTLGVGYAFFAVHRGRATNQVRIR